ncbi:MAG: hypothetical protein OEW22_09850 [Rubrivivax sp.]|nr:hypothetical protein [Rubrivivax sp.]
MMKSLVLAAALTFGGAALAQAPSSPAKKDLVAKILQEQQPQVENLARQLVSQPAAQLLQRAGSVVAQRVPADQREAMFKDLQAEARKYFDETYPLVREKALKLAPTTVGPVLEANLTEDELRQVLAVMKSPAYAKYQALGGDMQKALGEKLVAEVKDQVEPRVRALDKVMAGKLGIAVPAAAASAGGK